MAWRLVFSSGRKTLRGMFGGKVVWMCSAQRLKRSELLCQMIAKSQIQKIGSAFFFWNCIVKVYSSFNVDLIEFPIFV